MLILSLMARVMIGVINGLIYLPLAAGVVAAGFGFDLTEFLYRCE
jgi:hypothetical protein